MVRGRDQGHRSDRLAAQGAPIWAGGGGRGDVTGEEKGIFGGSRERMGVVWGEEDGELVAG